MIALFAQNDGGGAGFIIFLIIVIISVVSNFIRKWSETGKRKMPPPSPSQRPPSPTSGKETISLKQFLQEVAFGVEDKPSASTPSSAPKATFERPSPPPPPPPRVSLPVSGRAQPSVRKTIAQEPSERTAIDNKRFEKKFDQLRFSIDKEVNEFTAEIAKPSAKFQKPSTASAAYQIRKISIGPRIPLTGEIFRDGIILSEILRPPLAKRRTGSYRR